MDQGGVLFDPEEEEVTLGPFSFLLMLVGAAIVYEAILLIAARP